MPKIYESPDKGKTIFVREFGADPSTRVKLPTADKPTPKKDEK